MDAMMSHFLLATVVFGGGAAAFDIWAITHPDRFSKVQVLVVNSLAWLAVALAVSVR